MSELSLLTGQLLATNPQFAQAYRQLVNPALQSGDAVAGRLGINASLGDIESLFKDAVDKGYSASKQEYENTLNDYYRTILNNVGNIVQLLRANNEEAANTGASRGVVAANELSALLGAASEANQNASKLADQGITMGKQYGADIATALKDANTTYNDLRLQLGNLANADYLGQVQQYAAELAYLQQLGLTGGYGSFGGSGRGNYLVPELEEIPVPDESDSGNFLTNLFNALKTWAMPGTTKAANKEVTSPAALQHAANGGYIPAKNWKTVYADKGSFWENLGINTDPFLPDGTVNPNVVGEKPAWVDKVAGIISDIGGKVSKNDTLYNILEADAALGKDISTKLSLGGNITKPKQPATSYEEARRKLLYGAGSVPLSSDLVEQAKNGAQAAAKTQTKTPATSLEEAKRRLQSGSDASVLLSPSLVDSLSDLFNKEDDKKTKTKTYDYAKTGAAQTAAQNKAAADARAKAAAAEKARATEAQAAAKKRAAEAETQKQLVAAEKARVAAAQEAARQRAAAQANAAADAARAKAAAVAKAAADKARAEAAARAQAQASAAAAVGTSTGGQNITYNGGGQAQGVTGTANLQNQNPYISKPATTKPKKTYAQMMAERDAEARARAAKKK